MQLIGQENNKELIDRWKQLPNFIIIQGDKHTGKKYLTTYICKKFGLTYTPMKNSVKDIRNLLSIMARDSNTLYHFKDFDDASIQAKNALLKITEEPIPGNYIVITGGPQIKTLESRARKIIMEPYSLDDMIKYMKPKYPDEIMPIKLYQAGINSPAKVKFYEEYEKMEPLIDYAFEIFNKLTYLTPNTYIPMLQRFEDRYEPGTIDSCLLFLEMLINIIEYNIKNNTYYSYQFPLTALLNAKAALQREPTLRRKMLLYRVFYTISNEGGKNETSKRS